MPPIAKTRRPTKISSPFIVFSLAVFRNRFDVSDLSAFSISEAIFLWTDLFDSLEGFCQLPIVVETAPVRYSIQGVISRSKQFLRSLHPVEREPSSKGHPEVVAKQPGDIT